MKQKDNCIIGDPIVVDSFTSTWLNVNLHPTTFYRRYEDFQEGFKNTKDLYAALDMGQYVSVRFSSKEDLTEFYRRHHSYI